MSDPAVTRPRSNRPNIVIFYADDLGFGDVGCYGARRVATPNIDRLAASGIRFTQGYATAATCTPSRYSLLTGSYPFRNPAAAILPGDAPLIIDPDSPTLASLLQSAGYRTGIVGKWHLGLGSDNGGLDWNHRIEPGPNEVGFDSSFILAATNDRVPCVYLRDGRVENLDPADPIEVTYDPDGGYPDVPTGRANPELLRMRHSHGHDGTIVNGVGRIGHMRGGASALWDDETMAATFAGEARAFVSAEAGRPFFLYYALHQPHVPRIPAPRFAGSTALGPRGDVIAEMDWCVGEVLDELKTNGILDNTLVVFSSDNGPVLDDGYEDRSEELSGDHRPAGPLRGGKYSMFDGGTRVPFILSWPAVVSAGESDALVSHMDFLPSFARLVGAPEAGRGPAAGSGAGIVVGVGGSAAAGGREAAVGSGASDDGQDVLDALLGRSPVGRAELLVEGMQYKQVLRMGNWTYIPPHEGPAVNRNTGIELGNSREPQLYDLSADIGQVRNLAAEQPERVAAMGRRLREILDR